MGWTNFGGRISGTNFGGRISGAITLGFLAITTSSFFATAALAQTCPRFLPRDREAIKSFFAAPQSNQGVYGTLARMTTLAWANFYVVTSQFQRQAIGNEYAALLTGLDNAANNPGIPLSPIGRRFVQHEANSSNLGLAGTSIFGDTGEQSIVLSQQALEKLDKAMTRLLRCF